ncbi:hypothetical protein A7A08_03212 [Methyloligella halotolerans]|uniref:Zinc-finger domain-containing protein n=1 Tax=Methyloligella halotolerans TaxID=1177755 RepID=A0A1E2RUH9_9HYPH|nr:hypothetical protein [Methyloligella halotolerans]ODA65907.1 hypothetical protein A7A08_03212 [Methyloligella halotolerans]
MNAKTTIDFELLSAFVDGELDEVTRKRVLAALDADPQARAQVARIRKLKSDVASMPVDRARHVTATRKRRVLPVGAAIAAALVAIVLSGALAVGWIATDHSSKLGIASQIIAAHDQAGSSAAATMLVRGSKREYELFRMAGLHLTLDEVRPLPSNLVMRHRVYVGPHGCRISVFALPPSSLDAADVVAADAGLLSASWESGSEVHIVLARSMDPERFNAIATALKHISRPETVITTAEIPRVRCTS